MHMIQCSRQNAKPSIIVASTERIAWQTLYNFRPYQDNAKIIGAGYH